MSYSVIPIEKFKTEAKRLIKKYPSLKTELASLSNMLADTPNIGTPLGNNTYKIRVSIKSKGKGKSGGARVLAYLVTENREVYLLTIYDKNELDTIDTQTLEKIIKQLKH